MTGYMITDRRNIQTVPELDVKDQELAHRLATMPLSKVDSRVPVLRPEPNEKFQPYDLKSKGLELHFGEFLKHHSFSADSEGWKDQFKELLPAVVGDADLLLLGDEPVATFKRDTKLSLKRLASEQPQIIAEFTKMKWVEVFDEEAFKAKMPDVHAAYRGRSLRLKRRGPRAGLVLPA